jgi:acetylornithine deacetylase/succinyl-diaminopimelate desuccinylase-like protein
VASRAVALRTAPDLAVIGEASGLRLVRGQRGRAAILLEARGRMAHSSNPEGGVNAADRMVRLLSEIRERFEPPEDPFLGRGILVLVSLASLPVGAAGAIPDRCRAVFDRRLLLGESREGVLAGLQALLAKGGEPTRDLRLDVVRSEERCYTGAPIRGEHFAPAWVLEEGHPFLRTARAGLASAGLPAEVSPEPGFGTNGCGAAGRMGIPTLVFGPSREELVHRIDEYVELDQLLGACRGYYGIAAAVLGGA